MSPLPAHARRWFSSLRCRSTMSRTGWRADGRRTSRATTSKPISTTPRRSAPGISRLPVRHHQAGFGCHPAADARGAPEQTDLRHPSRAFSGPWLRRRPAAGDAFAWTSPSRTPTGLFGIGIDATRPRHSSGPCPCARDLAAKRDVARRSGRSPGLFARLVSRAAGRAEAAACRRQAALG